MTSISLLMIVRDAEQTLERAIVSARSIISSWTIVDTGSSDGTPGLVRELLEGIPGQLHQRPWVNFAHNRTEALELGRDSGTDYLLMLDADHELRIHGEIPELDADSYLLRIDDAWGGRLPLLTRAAHPFRYEGVAHAALVSDAPTRTEDLDDLSVAGGGGASREKLERDLEALTAAFADDPNDPRTVFYLAQTYRDLDRPHEAIRFYRLRAEMNGFAEERYFARFQLGKLLVEHVAFSAGAPELLRAWEERPTRVEALRALAYAAHSVADKYPLPTGDNLFVMPGAYRKETA